MESHEKKQINPISFLTMPIGCMLLVAAIIMNKYCPETTFNDFIKGSLFGLSLLLNVIYIIVMTGRIGKNFVNNK